MTAGWLCLLEDLAHLLYEDVMSDGLDMDLSIHSERVTYFTLTLHLRSVKCVSRRRSKLASQTKYRDQFYVLAKCRSCQVQDQVPQLHQIPAPS